MLESNKKYTHIFVDFDNTIYLWDRNSDKLDIDATVYLSGCINGALDYYSPEYINWGLIEYLKQQHDSTIHLITYTNTSLEGKIKFEFLREHCPNIFVDYIAVSEKLVKVHILNVYLMSGVNKNGILLIDDDLDTLDAARKLKYNVHTPQYIMGIMI